LSFKLDALSVRLIIEMESHGSLFFELSVSKIRGR